MRKDKDKCKNKHETTIGKIIYGFLLFLPLFAIGVTCSYAMFNKNAYKSYSGYNEEEAEYTQITSKNSLEVGKQYVLVNSVGNELIPNTSNGQRIYFEVEKVENYSGNYNLLSAKSVGLYSGSATVFYYYFYDEYNNLIGNNPLGNNNNFKLTITYTSNSLNANNLVLEKNATLFSVVYNQNDYIDSVFYYSIDKVQQSPLFNWAYNSVIYTGMNTFTTGLSITTPFIPLLMTYWLIISIVYFLYDIVLVILVVLHKKIHALEESI